MSIADRKKGKATVKNLDFSFPREVSGFVPGE